MRLRRRRYLSVEDVEAAVSQVLTEPDGLGGSTSSDAIAVDDRGQVLWSSRDDASMVEDLDGTLAGEKGGTGEFVRRLFQVGDEIEWRDKARKLHAGKVVEDELLGRCKVLLEGRGSARSWV